MSPPLQQASNLSNDSSDTSIRLNTVAVQPLPHAATMETEESDRCRVG